MTEEQRANGVGSIWILPYAHKGSIAEKLNSSIVEICSTLENSTLRNKKGEMKQAIAAFTVHPQDGLEGVKQATLKALVQGDARAAKLHCSVGRYSVLDDTLTPFWQLAEVVKFPVIVHAGSHASGNTASDELNNVEQLLSKYHNIQLIIAHSGHPAILKSIKLALKYDNVYLDTTPVGELSFLPPPSPFFFSLSISLFSLLNESPLSPLQVTRTPQYPPRSHPLYTDLINLAKQGRILFGTDMPNVAVPLAKQIQIVFQTFANKDWIRPTSNKWWTKRQEAQRAGSAVEEVLFGAARKLLSQVDISKAKQQVVKGNSGSSKI